MKRTLIFKTAILMITLSILGSVQAMASMGITGSLDVFNESTLAGWVLNEADHSADLEVQLLVTNMATGEIMDTLTTDTSHTRSDLIAKAGEDSTPAFTMKVDTSAYPDGRYAATAYVNGQAVTAPAYYTKGTAVKDGNGNTLTSLGTFRLTAYCPCRSCSAGWGRKTSSGAVATVNHTVAVDPKVIPMGSKLMINGTIYTAEDVGGGVKKKHVDIFHESHSQALHFGSRSAEVFLVQ